MKCSIFLFVLFGVFICSSSVFAEGLTYDQVLKDALSNCHKLIEAELDKEIKESTVREARYLRYPELSLKIYSEQVNDLSDDSGITTVGGTVFPDSSKFQNTAYVDLNYNLVDYGIRTKQVAMTRMDLDASSALVNKTKTDVEKAVLDLYSTILSLHMERRYRKRILDVMDRLCLIRKRTGDAGLTDKLSVKDRDITKVGMTGQLAELEFELASRLSDLSFYTGASYTSESLDVRPYSFEFKGIEDIDFRKCPEYTYYERQLQMKNSEIEIEKKKFYPSLDLYLRYSFYGMDDNDYFKSFDEVREKNFTTGIYTSIPLMENLKRRHTLSRLRSEKMKAKTVMEEKYSELKTTFGKLKMNYDFYQKDLENKRDLLRLVKEKSVMVKRLTDAKIIDMEPGLEQESELVKQELELEKKIIERMTALKHIMIQTEGAM